jgi:hypothetical protein
VDKDWSWISKTRFLHLKASAKAILRQSFSVNALCLCRFSPIFLASAGQSESAQQAYVIISGPGYNSPSYDRLLRYIQRWQCKTRHVTRYVGNVKLGM